MIKYLFLLVFLTGCFGEPDTRLTSDCKNGYLAAWKSLEHKAGGICLEKGTLFFHIYKLKFDKCDGGTKVSGDVYCRTGRKNDSN